MPGLITHYIHGEAVLNDLPPNIRHIIKCSREHFNIGTQGPDLFFYYLPAFLRRRLHGLGSKMHTGNFSMFVKGMLLDIKAFEQPSPLKAYMYGYLSHYALDAAAHPYIYYKTGIRKKDKLATLKYSVYHRSFETALDTIMIRLATGEKPANRKLSKMIMIRKSKRADISTILSRNIKRAYKAPISAKQVSRALGYMSKITWLLESKKGRRKRIMEFVENHTVKEKILSSLMHYNSVESSIDYLNKKQSDWYLPWDNKNARNETFVELFNSSIYSAKEMILICEDFFHGKCTLETALLKIKNLSFSTGLDYKEKVEFLFSDIVYETK